MRLNQYIAESGICSRREADRLIEAGKVTVNNKPAVIGQQVEEADIVKVSGQVIRKEEERVCLLVNKPVGITSTTDPADKTNIIYFVNYPKRLFMIGRLDKDSEGAILLTNDGNIVNALLRSENDHEKVYQVTVDKPVNQCFLDAMSAGVRIYNPVNHRHVNTKRCKVLQTGKCSFEIILTQGLNRQIRRMCDALGYHVVKLYRTRFLFISIGNLKSGSYRKLTNDEMAKIDAICKKSKRK